MKRTDFFIINERYPPGVFGGGLNQANFSLVRLDFTCGYATGKSSKDTNYFYVKPGKKLLRKFDAEQKPARE